MGRPKRHRHSKELEIGYGYGRTSGWYGVGATYRCKSCCECLWFEGGHLDETANAKKRKKNKRWNPDRDLTFMEKVENQRLNEEYRAIMNAPSLDLTDKQIEDAVEKARKEIDKMFHDHERER